MKDAHDPRDFRTYVTLNTDGSVAAVHQFDATVENPLEAAIEVTALGVFDFTAITIDPKLLVTHAAAKDALSESLAMCAAARGSVFTATQKITGALSDAVQRKPAADVAAETG